MTKQRLIVFLSVCFVFTATVYASYAWLDTVDLSTPYRFTADWTYDNNNHNVGVVIDRGAYNASNGTVQVSASVKVDEAKVIKEIRIETADDLNADGVIDSGEWASRATGTVTNSVNGTFATVPATDIDVKHDGYRLRWVWSDDAVATETILAPGVVEGP